MLADRFDHLADELEGGETVDREEIRELVARLESGVVLFRRSDGSDPPRQLTP